MLDNFDSKLLLDLDTLLATCFLPMRSWRTYIFEVLLLLGGELRVGWERHGC
jgi:hypothetical protein